MTRVCPWCKEEFTTRQTYQVCCSSRCGAFFRHARERGGTVQPDWPVIQHHDRQALIHLQAELARLEVQIDGWKRLNAKWRELLRLRGESAPEPARA